MSSRDQILAALRANAQPFDYVPPRPATYLPVTQISGSADDLFNRFKAELERLNGKVYRVTDTSSALDQLKLLIGSDSAVLTWEKLPLPGVEPFLNNLSVKQVVSPLTTGDGEARKEVMQSMAKVRVGITGADAGLATTGTLVLAANSDQARLVSLLPPVHIALLPLDRLYPNLESWIASEGRQQINQSSGVTFITGPSRTSDIEMQTILGVHGSQEVHVIIYPSDTESK